MVLARANMESKKKIPIPFTITIKNVILRDKFNLKYVRLFYTGNYKRLLREIKEDLNKWKGVPYLWSRKISIDKMSIIYKLICRFNKMSVKIWATFLLLKWTSQL